MTEPLAAAALRPQLAAFVERVHRETRIPGIAAGVSLHGERICAFAGSRAADRLVPLGSTARYHLGCATKLLLAIVVLELAEAGTLSLDAPLREYLPELRESEHGRAVRVTHLLAHTSGYRGTNLLDPSTRPDDWESFITYLREAPALFTPGTVFSYEHTEAVLLAEIVRRVTGQTSLALIVERLLDPLGIVPGRFTDDMAECGAGRHRFDERTKTFVALESAPLGAPFWLPAFSDFTLTLDELLAIAAAASDSAHGLLTATTVRRLQTSVVRLPHTAGGPLRELLPVAFGYGTAELRDGCRGNTGISAGQCLGIRFDARTGTAAAVALNAIAPHLRDLILATIGRELGGPPEQRRLAPFELDFAELEGTYLGPGAGVVNARCHGERMICEIGREHHSERLRVELGLDANGELVLRSPVPQLSLGFFAEPTTGAVGLMVGLCAYRRIPV